MSEHSSAHEANISPTIGRAEHSIWTTNDTNTHCAYPGCTNGPTDSLLLHLFDEAEM